MKERPILFSSPMVRAILDGRKTQTRRIAKVTDKDCKPGMITPLAGFVPRTIANHISYCPYGKQGDRLWVRETFGIGYKDGEGGYSAIPWTGSIPSKDGKIFFRADFNENKNDAILPWKPSIHMPRWASRILLEITGVRVERLQDIGEEDAKAEGSYVCDYFGRRLLDQSSNQGCYKWGYRSIWESLNGPGSWDLNPWVWVVEFKRIGE